jgi:hypothetical protein
MVTHEMLSLKMYVNIVRTNVYIIADDIIEIFAIKNITEIN